MENTTIQNKLRATGGRFTSLSVKDKGQTVKYCAKIVKVTGNTVTFTDVNTGERRRVALAKVATGQS